MFDSGLGGLTVFREVAKARPDARYVYVADDAFFPYGSHGETELVARVADQLIAREIASCFIDAAGQRTDTVVLACTHYPLLLERFTRLAPWPVTFVDPAPAIARRVADLLGPPLSGEPPSPARIAFTSGRVPSLALAAALAHFGMAG